MRSGDELGKWKWEIKLGKYKRKWKCYWKAKSIEGEQWE